MAVNGPMGMRILNRAGIMANMIERIESSLRR
jgi:hypothetical protein